MDEKQRLASSPSPFYQPRGSKDDQARPKLHHSYIPYRDRTFRRVSIIAICIVLAVWTFRQSLFHFLTPCNRGDHRGIIGNDLPNIQGGNQTRNVSLEAHIMSKCPDAKACLQELVVPAMEKFHDKVDFELSFIGR
jgi:hypothetical protein